MMSQVTASTSGRLRRGPFALAAALVYLLGFLSQGLLSAEVIGAAGYLPFALAQAVLTGVWYVVHARRLRDAGRARGLALGIAALYALAMVLLLLVMVALTPSSPSDKGGMVAPFAILYVIAMMFAEPQINALGLYVIGLLAVILAPMLIAVAFSIWAAARPSAGARPPGAGPRGLGAFL